MNFRPQKVLLPIAMGVASFLIGTGCEKDDVKVYHVDTNQVAASAAPNIAPAPGAAPDLAPNTAQSSSPGISMGSGGMPSTMPSGLPSPDNSGLPKLTYTVPPGWTEKAPTQMRVASFGASDNGKSVDISVVPLAGMGGGDFANVNRWRGQVGLPSAADGEISQSAASVTIAGTAANLYDINGTANGAPTRIIGAILPRDEAIYFFKMMGDSDLTEAQKAAFTQFLGSVQFGGSGAAPTAPSAMDSSQLPPGHPDMGSMGQLPPGHPDMGSMGNMPGMGQGMAAPDVSAGPKPTWTVPTGWQTGQLSQFLVAKYVIPGDNGTEADVNISSLSGDGGGLLPNVNRWRGQLGLSPMADGPTDSLDLPDGKATIVDFSGTDAKSGQAARLIGVIVPHGSQTWFYKLMGNPDVVARQTAAFKQFIQSARYPDAQ